MQAMPRNTLRTIYKHIRKHIVLNNTLYLDHSAIEPPTTTPRGAKGGAVPAILRAPPQDGRPDVHAQPGGGVRHKVI